MRIHWVCLVLLVACGKANTYPLTINNVQAGCNVSASVGSMQVASFSKTTDTLNEPAGATVDLLAGPVSNSFGAAQWSGATVANGAHATYVMTNASDQNVAVDCPAIGASP